MHYVYIIKSINCPDQIYVGYTRNLKQRLETHNSGGSIHTSRLRPWELIMHLVFSNKEKASSFEKYLKTYSGKAFAKKRFW